MAVLRHPMPYGDLAKQAVQRFADYADLDAADTTIEEREEYEPHIAEGNIVFAGIDYAAILDQAEQEADVILWDGGNNDTPFVKPNLHVVVVDPHRPGHELRYHPGETNLRMAHVCVVNKIDTAPPEGVEAVVDSIRTHNPDAKIVLAASPVPRRGERPHDQGQAGAGDRGRPDAHPRRDGLRRAALAAKANGAPSARRSETVRGRIDREDARGVAAHLRAPAGDGLWAEADGGAARDDRSLGRRPRPDRHADRPQTRQSTSTSRLWGHVQPQELGEPTLS